MRIALYARVSKAGDQTPENQLLELRRWAGLTTHTIIGEYVDELSSRDTRPRKEEVLRMIRLGQVDGVAFVALDRWGRTLSELAFELEEFAKNGWAMLSMKEGFDLTTAFGRASVGFIAVFANFERDRIRERTKAGLDRARAQGKKLGREGRPDKKPRKKRELTRAHRMRISESMKARKGSKQIPPAGSTQEPGEDRPSIQSSVVILPGQSPEPMARGPTAPHRENTQEAGGHGLQGSPAPMTVTL